MNKIIRCAVAVLGIFGLGLGISLSAAAAPIYAQCDTYINIRESYTTNSQCIGKIYNGNIAEILSETTDKYYIQSGNIKGWVDKEYFTTNTPEGYTVATIYPQQLNVRSAPSEDSDLFGVVYANQQIEAVNYENGWVTLAFEDDTYGYVDANYVGLETYYGTAETIEEELTREEAEYEAYIAAQNAAYEEYIAAAADYSQQDTSYVEPTNEVPATTYTQPTPTVENVYQAPIVENASTSTSQTEATTSVQSTSNGNGQYLSDYAKQYVGNPYVWGGTSLETGADCSGFTKAVLGANGIQVNGRTAADQAAGGTQISLSDAQAGDLIYYDNGNGVYHIAIYNGDGTVTHSSNSTSGVKVSDMNYSGNAAGAVRYW